MAGSNSQQCYVRAGRPLGAPHSTASCFHAGSSPKSHGNYKKHSQHTHHPQPSPPTHGGQYADDICVLCGEEMLVGPRFRSSQDDLWAGLNGTAQDMTLQLVNKGPVTAVTTLITFFQTLNTFYIHHILHNLYHISAFNLGYLHVKYSIYSNAR